MKLTRSLLPMLSFMLLGLVSCQDDRHSDENQEVEILPGSEIETDVGANENAAGEEGEDNTIYNELQENPELDEIAEGLEASGAMSRLQGEGPYTVFAPSDDAFAELSKEDLQRLKDPNRREQNRDLYEYYMVDGNMTADYFSKRFEVGKGPWNITTLQGEDIVASYEGDRFALTDAAGNRAVVGQSIETDNGTIHVTDQVLTPSGGFTGSEVEVNSEEHTDKQF